MNDTEERLTYFGTISLGGLIRLLEQRPKDQRVVFDFAGFAPDGIGSYRGYYDHLALGFKESEYPYEEPSVEKLLAVLREANGKTYEGYKGGDFTMNLDTPIWVANYSNCSSTTIVGLADCDWQTVILTGFSD